MFYSLYINVGGSNIMGYNIFISFRYSDGKQYKEELEQLFSLDSEIYNRSENEDRSMMSEETIRDYLYKKLKSTSVTIFIVTPESLKHKRNYYNQIDDWIYDELRYSLENRVNNRSNAMIAVYVPEVKNQLIAVSNHVCPVCKKESSVDLIYDVQNLFRKNMMNIKSQYKHNNCDGIYDSNYDSYCSLVALDDFKKNYEKYISIALEKRDRIYEYNIIKRI